MLTTVSFLRFQQNKAKAFAAMGILPRQLKKAAGLRFFKLMGSGKGNAFSLTPDFSRYCMLGTWESEEHAAQFFSGNKDWEAYHKLAAGSLHFYLQPLSAKGSWNQQQPFVHANEKPPVGEPVAILTRASLNWYKLPSFWRNARTATTDMAGAKGLHFSAGIGEVPYLEQATFSVWQSAEQIMQFVTAPAHLQAIKLRHQENWYREELFARFTIIAVRCSRPELFPGAEGLVGVGE